MSDLEDRLRAWFAAEVNRAEQDLASARVGARPKRRRRPVPGLALVGLLAAVAVLAVGLRPSSSPDTGKGPQRNSPSTSALADDTIAGPDGIPTFLAGERVLSVAEAVIHAQAATSDEPFLVGGWWLNSGARCAAIARRIHPLISSCGDGSIRSGPSLESNGLAVISPDEPLYDGPIVAQVHTRDPRAATCRADRLDRCLKAVVVDKVVWRPAVPVIVYRYPDGIPADIAGVGVYRASDLGAFRLEPGRFLVAGWALGGVPESCPAVRLGPSVIVPPANCASNVVASEPTGSGMLWPNVPLPTGPVVLAVRLTPEPVCPSGQECPATPRRVTVEEIVWAGDAVTATDPLTIDDVFGVLRSEAGDVWLDVQPGRIPTGDCEAGFPASTWLVAGTDAVGYVAVFPTTAARQAAGGNLHSDGYSGIGPDGEPCRVFDDGPASLWIAVDNVLVQVFGDDALARQIRARLDALLDTD